jgi:hypothetical protein
LALARLDLQVLTPTFRHFLDRLRDGAQLNSTIGLKECLGCELINADEDLEDCSWFQLHFPEVLQLAHALETFKVLSMD